MLRFAVALTVIFATGLVSQAEAKLAGCYSRTYTKAELARHPDMLVAAIQLKVGTLPEDPTSSSEVSGKFRGEKDLTGSPIYCKPKGAALKCYVEGDGGNFTITEILTGARIDSEGFSFDDEHSFSSKSEKVFHLKSAPKVDCK